MCQGSTLPGEVLGLAIKLGSLLRATFEYEKNFNSGILSWILSHFTVDFSHR